MKRAFIYTRVSTLEQAKGGYSISEQESKLKSYAEAKGLEVIKVYTDPGFSGAKMDRPGLQDLIQNIHRTDVVLVYKLDRLSRSQKDTLHLIEEVFIKHDVDFISLNESFDTSSSFGRAMIGILSVFAQLEREQIKERFEMGREGRAKAGKWYGGGGKQRMIVGYDYADGNLVVNEYEAGCVRLIYDMKIKGVGVTKIWEAVQSKYPGVLTSMTTINRIAENDAYLGVVNWKGEKYQGLHDPIIDQKTFNEAQSIRKRVNAPKSTKYVLTGLITCGYCDSPLYGSGGFKRKDGTQANYYACRGRRKYRDRDTYRPHCKMKPIRQDKLDKYILEEVKHLKLEEVKNQINKKDNKDEIEAIKKEVKAIEKQSNKLIDLFSLDGIDFESLNDKISELNTKKEKLNNHISELESEETNEESLKDKLKTISKLSEVDFDSMENEKKRIIVAKLIKNITSFNDNITIEWAF